MQEQFEAGVIIEAPVIDHNKGGLIVDCGIRGFVPISQIVDFPRRPQNEQPRDAAQEIAEKLQPFVGRKLRLKILEVNRKANRLILSEKVALYEERREKRDELFSSLQVGQKVTGTVRSIAPFGVFIDLGGIDGLVHKSELSWNKVNNPEAGYKVGDEVEAEVIDINHERGRISLSIRRLQPDPWQSTVADFKVGDVIDGTVTKLVNFGAFVRVREGLEGLIHISELSPPARRPSGRRRPRGPGRSSSRSSRSTPSAIASASASSRPRSRRLVRRRSPVPRRRRPASAAPASRASAARARSAATRRRTPSRSPRAGSTTRSPRVRPGPRSSSPTPRAADEPTRPTPPRPRRRGRRRGGRRDAEPRAGRGRAAAEPEPPSRAEAAPPIEAEPSRREPTPRPSPSPQPRRRRRRRGRARAAAEPEAEPRRADAPSPQPRRHAAAEAEPSAAAAEAEAPPPRPSRPTPPRPRPRAETPQPSAVAEAAEAEADAEPPTSRARAPRPRRPDADRRAGPVHARRTTTRRTPAGRFDSFTRARIRSTHPGDRSGRR